MIVGLDIGTSKVVAIVAEVDADGSIEVVGIGSHPSKGHEEGRGGQHRIDGAVHTACRG
jgi:cell division protein FtsA